MIFHLKIEDVLYIDGSHTAYIYENESTGTGKSSFYVLQTQFLLIVAEWHRMAT